MSLTEHSAAAAYGVDYNDNDVGRNVLRCRADMTIRNKDSTERVKQIMQCFEPQQFPLLLRQLHAVDETLKLKNFGPTH